MAVNNSGDDARTRIICAAVSLAKKRDIDKLTVKEIVDEAQVARRTFYNYYHDIPGLMDCILESITQEMIEKSMAVPETSDVLGLFIDAMEQGWPVLNRILDSKFRAGTERQLLEAFKKVIGKVITERTDSVQLTKSEVDFWIDISS